MEVGCDNLGGDQADFSCPAPPGAEPPGSVQSAPDCVSMRNKDRDKDVYTSLVWIVGLI